MPALKDKVEKLLAGADIDINGARPWDIRVHDARFYRRALLGGSLGLGESYMDGWWDCGRLDEFFYRILKADLGKQVKINLGLAVQIIHNSMFNRQDKKRALEVGEEHYDLGNDLYAAMLDRRMTYTCGYWRAASDLDEAQEHKLELVCRKLYIRPGERLLDIGCGWGSLCRYAAERHGAETVGVTISKEQVAWGMRAAAELPVEIRFQDYRDVEGEFDKIASLGMFEHVGYKNHRQFMEKAHANLKRGGLFLLHTIGSNVSALANDPWIDKYIFPNGVLPSIRQIGRAIEGLFVMEDWHNFGTDYDQTLLAWHANFVRGWPGLKAKYGDRFYRMWTYYLLSCAGAFRSRGIQLWQIVLSKDRTAGYLPVR